MSKTYTAQEMRLRADKEERYWHDHVTAAMLRQAADAMDREAKREKKWEYSVKFIDGIISPMHEDERLSVGGGLKAVRRDGLTAVRREVGEWEEVRDEKL